MTRVAKFRLGWIICAVGMFGALAATMPDAIGIVVAFPFAFGFVHFRSRQIRALKLRRRLEA